MQNVSASNISYLKQISGPFLWQKKKEISVCITFTRALTLATAASLFHFRSHFQTLALKKSFNFFFQSVDVFYPVIVCRVNDAFACLSSIASSPNHFVLAFNWIR